MLKGAEPAEPTVGLPHPPLLQRVRSMAAASTSTPRVPKVTLTTFTEYLTATSSAQIDCVFQQIRTYEQNYQPGPAFYKDFVEAVVKGRATGADHLVLQRVIQAQRNEVRRDHYTALAEHWLAISALRLPIAPYGRATWATPKLVVNIRPDFAVRDPEGKVFVIKFWLKEQVLTADAARATLHLLDRHMLDIYPGGSPLVVDVRREKLHRQTRRAPKRGYDDWLENAAESMGNLWLRLAAA